MDKVYRDFSGSDDFCSCDNLTVVYTESDHWGYWDVCNTCNKAIEDSYTYNSFDLSSVR